ncbi:MAG: M20/M25/M40 family metallo-hydrolase [Candidatus Rokubacteria bacterium]|nr:M20/M25/M40 family metallo-hydrolase [Candidatus Rokubacteria bacterium]
MINQGRLKGLLLELVGISSVSRREREVALRLAAELEALGAEVEIDGAGERVGGDVGNVIARIRGTVPGALPLLLSAHMDTVVPGENVKPIVEGDIVRTDGSTVLGGDDKSGCAIIVEAVRTLRERGVPHGDIEAVFTICEEVGLLGAKHLDVGRLRARTGLVLDSDGVDELITHAPAANRLEVRVHGKEAHAGVVPEQGISAIKVAAEAIAGMRLGRIDAETTANLGIIQGGLATNIVPPAVLIRGEARSRDVAKLEAQTEHMRACFLEAARRHRLTVDGQEYEARVEVEVQRDFDPMALSPDARIVRLVARASRNLGRNLLTRPTGGGCDANVLNGRGLQVANLGTGMREIHTVKEWLDLRDLYRTTELVLEVVRLNASGEVE